MVKARVAKRWQRWLDKRIPPRHEVVLDQKKIFVFPSKAGFLYGAMLVVMLMTAINYQNNSIYLLTFFLAGLFVVAIQGAYSNMAGLKIQRMAAEASFAGEDVSFRFSLAAKDNARHQSIEVGWPGGPEVVGSLGELSEQILDLHVRAKKRGTIRAARLRVQSYYPLGLIRAWSWVDLDLTCPVYPKPIALDFTSSGGNDADNTRSSPVANDELANIRSWRQGDSKRRLLWKAYAKTGALLSLDFEEPGEDAVWLSWDQFEGLEREWRLSGLCQAALDLTETGREFGLRIPGTEIEPSSGQAHLHQILLSLAQFDGLEYSM
ncbi:MAG: DUF58 domain-containing protein [Pseudomonadales bacterium]